MSIVTFEGRRVLQWACYYSVGPDVFVSAIRAGNRERHPRREETQGNGPPGEGDRVPPGIPKSHLRVKLCSRIRRTGLNKKASSQRKAKTDAQTARLPRRVQTAPATRRCSQRYFQETALDHRGDHPEVPHPKQAERRALVEHPIEIRTNRDHTSMFCRGLERKRNLLANICMD
ncbi:hypothetical protein HPB48_000930 [Haemaphysalis longicornis]|uniref:Uncharacterized protein n=1 Tax=Haemaphysalis longicornis TaxID=44386 RepID=A0A9J6H5D4_HAELO|nr:hypothetical protein HPB48_000930 [Haemaphysalis longicornis]